MATNVENNTPASGMPHLESLDRVMKLPVVEAAYNQGVGVYGKVKGANSLFNWALSTAEATVQIALTTATPLVQKLDRPLQTVDQGLVRGLDIVEARIPIVKEQPQQIYETAKAAVAQRVQPHLSKVCAVKESAQQKAASLKELSWNKANEVLATQYGQMALNGVDSTSALAERLLDYYFPAEAEDNDQDDTPISPAEDPVLHTVQTVGRLSNKAARRIYRSVSRQLKNLKTQDVRQYAASLVAVLQLTNYLQQLNAQPVTNGEPVEEKPQNKAKEANKTQ